MIPLIAGILYPVHNCVYSAKLMEISVIAGVVGDPISGDNRIELIQNKLGPQNNLLLMASYEGIGKCVIDEARAQAIKTIIFPPVKLTETDDERPIYRRNHEIALMCDLCVIFKSDYPSASTKNVVRWARKKCIENQQMVGRVLSCALNLTIIER